MADMPKQFVFGTWIVAGIVAAVAIVDLTTGMPFSGTHTKVMDIIFLISCGILGYLGWDAYKDLR